MKRVLLFIILTLAAGFAWATNTPTSTSTFTATATRTPVPIQVFTNSNSVACFTTITATTSTAIQFPSMPVSSDKVLTIKALHGNASYVYISWCAANVSTTAQGYYTNDFYLYLDQSISLKVNNASVLWWMGGTAGNGITCITEQQH